MTAAESSCDWCGNTGHTPDAHPLPHDHPHHDPDVDDNPLLEVALEDFTDFLNRDKVESTPAVPAQVSPIGRLLGTPGSEPTCNDAVHWWPTMSKSGTCFCGQRTAD